MKIFYNYIFLLLVLVCSCSKKEKSRIVTVNITKNDSVIKTTKTKINDNYKIVGQKNDINQIIKSDKTSSQIQGKFAVGVFEKSNSKNKVISFLTDEDIGLPDLSNLNSASTFSIIDEYKATINSNNVYSHIIEKYSDTYGDYQGKYLRFVFLTKEKDTLGYQNTFFIDVNNRLYTIHYLNNTMDSYNELSNMFEEFAQNTLQ